MKRMLLIGLCLVGHGVNYVQADDDYHEDVTEAMEEYDKDMDSVSNPLPPVYFPHKDPEKRQKWHDIETDNYNQQVYQRNQDIDSANSKLRERMIDINQDHEDHYHR
jgi:hypothetical protein